MSQLRRDLVERRLWIVILALVVAVAAVPFVLHGHGDASAEVVAPPVTGPGGVPAVTGAGGGAAKTASDPAAGPESVSAAVRHAETTRDPFAATTSASSSTTTAAGATPTTATTATTSAPPSTPTATATPRSSNGAPLEIAAAGPVTPSGATHPDPSPATPSRATHSDPRPATRVVTRTVTVTTATPPTTITETTPRTTTSPKPSPADRGPWTVYAVSAAVTATRHVVRRTDLARLTPLPSARSPKVMFTGVLDQGHDALFALGDGVRATGPGRCRPSRVDCSAIALASGQAERLSWFAPDGATVTDYLTDRITPKKVHSPAAVRIAFARVSRAGRCELDLADPVAYDERRGTVSDNVTAACRGVRHAVPFPGTPAGS